MKNIVLASASPRRTEILKMLGIEHTVKISNAEENLNDEVLSSKEMAMKHSLLKASDVADQLRNTSEDNNYLIIGADTIVTFDPDFRGALGKPSDKDDAFRMLKALSGRRHYVITGVTIIDLNDDTVSTDCEITAVDMIDFSEEDIWAYINTGEPMDKAGAYGIQGLGSLFVKRIEGCYFNVVGLPVQITVQMLKKCGYTVL